MADAEVSSVCGTFSGSLKSQQGIKTLFKRDTNIKDLVNDLNFIKIFDLFDNYCQARE